MSFFSSGITKPEITTFVPPDSGDALTMPHLKIEGARLAFNDLLQQPGFRVTYDLAVDFMGNPEDWDYSEIYGRNPIPEQSSEAKALNNASGHELVRSDSPIMHSLRPADVEEVLKLHMDEYGYKDTVGASDDAIKELIEIHAPMGHHNLVWSLYGKLSEDGDRNGRIKRLCHGSSIAIYMQSLVSLHFMGPKSAYRRMNSAADRDDYPIWYGHFNQVIGEFSDVARRHSANGIDAMRIKSLLEGMRMSDSIGRMIGKQDYHSPSSRGMIARVAIANVPWHPRHAEAVTAAYRCAPIEY